MMYCAELKHSFPQQSPQVDIQWMPCLRHVQELVPHWFFDFVLHLHVITFRRLSGETALSVVTG